MSGWWHSRNPRERLMVVAAALLVGGLLLALLVVEPYFKRDARLRLERQQLQDALVVLQADVARLEAGRGRTTQTAVVPRVGQSLLGMLDQSARDAGLADGLNRAEPVGEDQVRIWFSGAPFEVLAAWLERLATLHGVDVVELQLNRAEDGTAGAVDAQVLLREARR